MIEYESLNRHRDFLQEQLNDLHTNIGSMAISYAERTGATNKTSDKVAEEGCKIAEESLEIEDEISRVSAEIEKWEKKIKTLGYIQQHIIRLHCRYYVNLAKIAEMTRKSLRQVQRLYKEGIEKLEK